LVEVSDRFYVRGTAVSREFREGVLRLYPQLRENRRWRGFFELLCFNTFHEDETRHQVIPFDTVRVAAGLAEGTTPKEFPTGRFLDDFKAHVLPGMVVGAYRPCALARTVVDTGFSPDMRELLAWELRLGRDAPEHVNFITGEPTPWKSDRSV